MFSARTLKAVTVAFATVVFAASAGSAFAETKWEASHPRRDQVNDRLEHLNQRINEERREGEISRHQARKLHREERHIRQEERRMAAHHGGHITSAEQARLNRQENKLSREIGR